MARIYIIMRHDTRFQNSLCAEPYESTLDKQFAHERVAYLNKVATHKHYAMVSVPILSKLTER